MNRYALKYWLKHKKQAMLVIMSILLSMVILMDTTFLVRSSMATEYAHNLSEGGDYNFIFADISREETEALAESGMFEEIGILYTVGVLQAEEGIQYPLTACDIKGAELYLPACEEGRYPDKEDELAASADRLKQLGREQCDPYGIGEWGRKRENLQGKRRFGGYGEGVVFPGGV